ncbi:alpha/beta fold hydrolase [Sphingomonas ginkgonis]|uniref:Alpha/beta fold hydrolase n=1 Tax=Sphingomonas ginkgonis TaxID=2315330 RepID=A0A429V6V0_9SPHN|nr:alpha/beta fold hydrolase [Sphingomonas ginkgonis]RST29660.1 alpha/beta fold hydrolase [Sphingomonas ginkgonis]
MNAPHQPPITALGPLAVRHRLPATTEAPTLVFLPGYASDMEGGKAVAIDGWCGEQGIGCLRFDYRGTGSSAGQFEDGTLEGWLQDAADVSALAEGGPLILAGSSMGGWIALHLALRLGDQFRGLLGIAAAPDFTDWGYTADEKAALAEIGRLERPNPYGPEPGRTFLPFWQSGERLKLLDGEIAIDRPVRLVHGDRDKEVPFSVAVQLKDQLRSADVQLHLVKGGGHRLSESREIRAILRALADLVELAR